MEIAPNQNEGKQELYSTTANETQTTEQAPIVDEAKQKQRELDRAMIEQKNAALGVQIGELKATTSDAFWHVQQHLHDTLNALGDSILGYSTMGAHRAVDAKDYVVEKGADAKDYSIQKGIEAKDFTVEKLEKAKEFTVAKSIEAKDLALQKGAEAKEFTVEKLEKAKEFTVAKSIEAKDLALQKGAEAKDFTVRKSLELKDLALQKGAEAKDFTAEKLEKAKEFTVAKSVEAKDIAVEKATQLKDLTVEKAHDLSEAAKAKIAEMNTTTEQIGNPSFQIPAAEPIPIETSTGNVHDKISKFEKMDAKAHRQEAVMDESMHHRKRHEVVDEPQFLLSKDSVQTD